MNDIDTYIFVRNYLKKFNKYKCMFTNTFCFDCGFCWFTDEEKNYVLGLFKYYEEISK